MIPELLQHVPDKLQQAYEVNRPEETWETPPLSEIFFTKWRQEGLVPAFYCVQRLVESNGHTQTTLKALGIIFGSSMLATGLTQYVENIRTNAMDNHYSIPQRAGLALYHASVGIIMAGQSPATEDDAKYSVTHDTSGDPLILHNQGGHMTHSQAEAAIKKGFF